jgi:hypothetical protein
VNIAEIIADRPPNAAIRDPLPPMPIISKARERPASNNGDYLFIHILSLFHGLHLLINNKNVRLEMGKDINRGENA